MIVADLLQDKKYRILTIAPTEPIPTLAKRLSDAHVGCMIVSRTGRTVDGIISERDIVRGLAKHGGRIEKLTVADLMTKSVVTCSPNDDVANVARTMTQRRIRHIPVQDGDKLIGVVSIGDVLKHRLGELELQANVLRDYTIALR